MTGNNQGNFRQTFQGPRGIPSALGVPFPRRGRRPLINVQKIDAEARAKNAQLEAERLRLLREDPEMAKVLEEEAATRLQAEEKANAAKKPANDSDCFNNARETIEKIAAGDKAANRGALEEPPEDLAGLAADVARDHAENGQPKAMGTPQEKAPAKPATGKPAAKKRASRKNSKTTTITT